MAGRSSKPFANIPPRPRCSTRRRYIWDTVGVEHYLLVAARGTQQTGADKSIFQGVVED